jgi:hypothetical protein
VKDRKILVVYNTCGINRDNTDWYIKSINSFLGQDLEGYRVVLSSCLNSSECIKKLYSTFGNKISYSFVADPLTVNITFNKAVKGCIKEFGEFESYLYIDSGCSFDDQKDILSKLYESYKKDEELKNGIISIQVSTDEGLDQLGGDFKYESSGIQIKNRDHTIPIGKAINLHASLFSNEIFKKYDNILPDVFAAFCTESTFSFLAASVNLKWVILADRQIRHLKAIDGPVASQPHRVAAPDKDGQIVQNNSWNNLLCGRSALNFINDKEAIDAGLGYEECQNIMIHKKEAYNNGRSLQPEKLKQSIQKFFFLKKEELDYDKVSCKFVP